MAMARAMKIGGTPTLLIGKVVGNEQVKFIEALPGAIPLRDIEKAFEKGLKDPPASNLYPLVLGITVAAIGGGFVISRRLRRLSRPSIAA